MKRFAIAGLALFAIVVSVLGGTLPKAHAVTGGLTISPTSVDQEIAPGASYRGTVLVINQGDAEISYRIYATPYSVTGEEYKPYFSPVPGATDITSWFTFGKTDGTLKVAGQDSVAFTIKVPAGTGAGSYYGTIFAETEDKASGSGVITRKRVGSVVYVRVTGQTIEQGNVSAWSMPWLQRAPLSGAVKIANTGSVHFQSKVNVTISDLFGSTKFNLERDPKILPQKQRSVPIVWDKGASFGLFKVSGNVTYLGKTQKLPTKIVLIASMPMRIIGLCVLVVFIVGLVFLGKRRVARK